MTQEIENLTVNVKTNISSRSLLSFATVRRLAPAVSALCGITMTLTFGVYAVLSYKATLVSNRLATFSNQLTLLEYCQDHKEDANRPACRLVLASNLRKEILGETIDRADPIWSGGLQGANGGLKKEVISPHYELDLRCQALSARVFYKIAPSDGLGEWVESIALPRKKCPNPWYPIGITDSTSLNTNIDLNENSPVDVVWRRPYMYGPPAIRAVDLAIHQYQDSQPDNVNQFHLKNQTEAVL